MIKEYLTTSEVAGPLIIVEKTIDVKYQELVEIELSSGEIRASEPPLIAWLSRANWGVGDLKLGAIPIATTRRTQAEMAAIVHCLGVRKANNRSKNELCVFSVFPIS